MSVVNLSTTNYKHNDELREMIEHAPKSTRGILLLPRKAQWKRFTSLVKEQIGAKKTSRMVNYLIYKWLQDIDNQSPKPLEFDNTVLSRNDDRSPVNMSVDHELWTQFTAKISSIYGVKKIQTLVLDMIVEDYLEFIDEA